MLNSWCSSADGIAVWCVRSLSSQDLRQRERREILA